MSSVIVMETQQGKTPVSGQENWLKTDLEWLLSEEGCGQLQECLLAPGRGTRSLSDCQNSGY